MAKNRQAVITRKTKETAITVRLNLEGKGRTSVRTGLPFLDHMLTLLGTHGALDLSVAATGDLDVDIHHTNEDVGLVIGAALLKALGDRRGINRFGWAYVPMEEALARVVLDISGRPKLVMRDARRPGRRAAGSGTSYQWTDLEHWLESFARAAKLTIHVDVFAGDDFHHTAEAVFKALARALAQAVRRGGGRPVGVPSSKGMLEK